MVRILVVCTGNVCRSPMAEGLLRKLVRDQGYHGEIVVESAGTFPVEGASASIDAIENAAEEGVDIRGHVARPLTGKMVERTDLILVMEDEHLGRLAAAFPTVEGRAHLVTTYGDPNGDPLGVPDPIGQGREIYRKAYRLIESGLQSAMPKIIELVSAKDDATGHSTR